MSFSEQLKSVRLRATAVPREKPTDPLLCPDSETYQRMMEETEFERYYPQIRQWTFPSLILPISSEQIKALREAHLLFKQSLSTSDDEKTEECLRLFPSLLSLSKEIDACDIPRPMFVRLSTRSPKDALLLLNREKFRLLFQKTLEELPIDETSGTRSVDRASRRLLLFQNGIVD